jgi:lantibiotic transport system permease protein
MEEDLTNKLDNLKKPNMENIYINRQLKFLVVNSKKSTAMGIWFILLPAYFLFSVFLKYYFHVNMHIFDIFKEFLSNLDKSTITRIISPVIFVGLPILGIVLNALSIIFFQHDRSMSQLHITIKLKFINILLILLSLIIVLIFITYLITENIR